MNQVTDFFQHLLNVGDWPARWVCGKWTAFHGWMYILSDTAISTAYFVIPLLLAVLLYKRKDVPLRPVVWLFVGFILLCGSTHLMDAVTFWWPAYRLNGLLRAGTAAISWATVFALVQVVPKVLEFKSPAELERIIHEQTAALQRSNKDLEQFSRVVSHDLRTPLNTMMLSAEKIKLTQSLDADGLQTVEDMQKSVNRMSSMILGILEYARIGQGDFAINPIDLDKIVQEEANLLMKNEHSRNIQLRIGKIHSCLGNEVLIRRVVYNLLSNAIKYTGKKDPAVIEIGCQSAEGWETYFIKDNGEGFEAQHKEAIFGLFKRYAGGEFEGSGVGLAIAKSTVERLGGEIWAESEKGKGSVFYFKLPGIKS